jgi:hypothetical protein
MIENEKLHRLVQKDLRWQENLFVSLLQSYPVSYKEWDETGYFCKFKNISMSIAFVVDRHGPFVLSLCVNSIKDGIYCIKFTQHSPNDPYAPASGFQHPSWKDGPFGDAMNGNTEKWLNKDLQQAYFGHTCTLDEEIAREIDPKIEKGPHNYFKEHPDDEEDDDHEDDQNDLWPEDAD